MGNFELKKIISAHQDSINALSFSHDGSLFASGGDNGLINVFQGHGSGQWIHQFQVKAPVTTLLWCSHFGHTILAGDASSNMHTLCLDVQSLANTTISVSTNKCARETTEAFQVQQRNLLYHVFNRVHGPVHCIAQSGIWLAIGSGKVIQLVKQGTID
jgi:WD40 repeat protein